MKKEEEEVSSHGNMYIIMTREEEKVTDFSFLFPMQSVRLNEHENNID